METLYFDAFDSSLVAHWSLARCLLPGTQLDFEGDRLACRNLLQYVV